MCVLQYENKPFIIFPTNLNAIINFRNVYVEIRLTRLLWTELGTKLNNKDEIEKRENIETMRFN